MDQRRLANVLYPVMRVLQVAHQVAAEIQEDVIDGEFGSVLHDLGVIKHKLTQAYFELLEFITTYKE